MFCASLRLARGSIVRFPWGVKSHQSYDIYPDTQGFSDFYLIGSPFLHSLLETASLSVYAIAHISHVMYAMVRVHSILFPDYWFCTTG